VKGRIRNRPAAGFERAVCCAVLVLPGEDTKERIASPQSTPSASRYEHILDPGSTGGMLDAMARGFFGADPDLPPQLRAALNIFRRSR
jgi:hypothetical protein